MRYARCALDGREFFALVEGDEVVEISRRAAGESARPRGAGIRSLPSFCCRRCSAGTFYAAGFNYKAHNRHHEELGYDPVKVGPHPEVGYRAQSALAGHGRDRQAGRRRGPVRDRSRGRRGDRPHPQARDPRRGAGPPCSAGPSATTSAPATGSTPTARSGAARTADTFKPMGPWIETDVDPLRVHDDRASQRGRGRDVRDRRHDLRPVRLHRRDDEVHHPPPRRRALDGRRRQHLQMDAGDVIDIEISGIGTLTNPVVGEAADSTRKDDAMSITETTEGPRTSRRASAFPSPSSTTRAAASSPSTSTT